MAALITFLFVRRHPDLPLVVILVVAAELLVIQYLLVALARSGVRVCIRIHRALSRVGTAVAHLVTFAAAAAGILFTGIFVVMAVASLLLLDGYLDKVAHARATLAALSAAVPGMHHADDPADVGLVDPIRGAWSSRGPIRFAMQHRHDARGAVCHRHRLRRRCPKARVRVSGRRRRGAGPGATCPGGLSPRDDAV